MGVREEVFVTVIGIGVGVALAWMGMCRLYAIVC